MYKLCLRVAGATPFLTCCIELIQLIDFLSFQLHFIVFFSYRMCMMESISILGWMLLELPFAPCDQFQWIQRSAELKVATIDNYLPHLRLSRFYISLFSYSHPLSSLLMHAKHTPLKSHYQDSSCYDCIRYLGGLWAWNIICALGGAHSEFPRIRYWKSIRKPILFSYTFNFLS